jgi:Arm DNA-binding domain
MTRILGRLSAVRVQSVRKRGYYGDGGGLYLRVAPGGAKGWIFRYGGRGRRRDMGLGGYPAINLRKARELAGDCRSVLAAGLDPIAARNEKRAAAAVEAAKAMTFADCATAYINAHEAGWRNPKHRQQWKNTLATYVSPVVGSGYRARAQGARTYLVQEARDRLAGARAHGSRARLGQGARLSHG